MTDINTNTKLFDIPNTKLVLDLSQFINPTLNLEETASLMQTSIETVLYYSKRKKELPYVSIGKGDMVFLRSDVLRFLEHKKTNFVCEWCVQSNVIKSLYSAMSRGFFIPTYLRQFG